MSNLKIYLVIILSMIHFFEFSNAQETTRTKSLSQLDFDKGPNDKPLPDSKNPENELFNVINNESQIKQIQNNPENETNLIKPSNNIGDMPTEENNKKSINQLD